MFVIRSLFWFAVVALLMPRGPDLGLDFHQLRTDLAANHVAIHRIVSWTPLRDGFAQARIEASDPVRIWRTDMLERVATVRTELATARAGRSEDWTAHLLTAFAPRP